MPSPRVVKQKELERRILEAARATCSYFPSGIIECFEEPDLRIVTSSGLLYIEVTELVRSEGENSFPPVQTEKFHLDLIALAQKYYVSSAAAPADVLVYFVDEARCKEQDPEGWRRLTSDGKRIKERMARTLADFVADKYKAGDETRIYTQLDDLPTGFAVIRVSPSTTIQFRGLESGPISPLNYDQLAATIGQKNDLLAKYRLNAPAAPIWLLIANGPSIPRGVPIPAGFDAWKFTFGFEKVVFFSGMENSCYDIKHQ